MFDMKRSVRLHGVLIHLKEFGMKNSDFEQMSDVALDKLSYFLTHSAIERQELEMEMEDMRRSCLQYLRARGM